MTFVYYSRDEKNRKKNVYTFLQGMAELKYHLGFVNV